MASRREGMSLSWRSGFGAVGYQRGGYRENACAGWRAKCY